MNLSNIKAPQQDTKVIPEDFSSNTGKPLKVVKIGEDEKIWSKSPESTEFVSLASRNISESLRKNLRQPESLERVHRNIIMGPGSKEKMKNINKSEYYKAQINEMEYLLHYLSEKILEHVRKYSKGLRDLFNVFSRNCFGYLEIEEYKNLINSVTGDERLEEGIIEALFKLYSTEITKRLSFKMFSHLVNMGNKVNTIYLKLKYQFGKSKFLNILYIFFNALLFGIFLFLKK